MNKDKNDRNDKNESNDKKEHIKRNESKKKHMRKLILIVDDDADILKLLEMRLAASDYQVITAQNGAEALTLFSVKQPALIISDLRMPVMDGFALFDAVHKMNATIPFILLTAHGSIPEAVHATQKGMFSFLTKPFNSQMLLQLVGSALKTHLNEQEAGMLKDTEINDTGFNEAGFNEARFQEARFEKTRLKASWCADIIYCSGQMDSLLAQAKLVAITDASVLIQGDSGTGKELIANAIHKASQRINNPFVAINCAALPEALLESELFGHVKGAFTGATRDHTGLFKNADGGTLFLDEIGDMPLAIQAKLLRALQERVIRPVGATQNIAINVRLICATHKNLMLEMQAHRFREDLFYRINVVQLEVPPLASRREDIGLLANYFLNYFNQKYQKKCNGFAPEALETLLTAPWPGNVRQLQNAIEQVIVLATTPIITNALIQKALQDNMGSMQTFDAARKHFEHTYLTNLLKATLGNVAQSARIADRNRTDFYKLLQRHQINPALFKSIETND